MLTSAGSRTSEYKIRYTLDFSGKAEVSARKKCEKAATSGQREREYGKENGY